MEKVILSAPFAKTIETEDGGRQVFGWATLEVKDKSGEIADFEGTVKAFEKWSNETSERTGGRNLGPVRLMHQPIAVGKTTTWQPSETTIQDEDGNEKTVKGIWVGAYVPPTKPDVIRDIDEGILSAFSIGGSYEKRWWDDGAQAFRYIPQLSEYSLVDNPCVPGADITQVIAKADVPWKEGASMNSPIETQDAPKGGDNTMTKGEENKMDLETVIKAAETAGLNMDQIQAFFKALTPADQAPAPVDAKTVDGDGDDDDNKEFPAENEHAADQKKAESDVKDAEEESGVAEKAAEADIQKGDVVSDDDQPEDDSCPDCGENPCKCDKAEKAAPAELQKQGKAISNQNMKEIAHAVNHLDAVKKGTTYTVDDHMTVESQFGQGGTGEESPEVVIGKAIESLFAPSLKVFEEKMDDFAKSFSIQLQKAAYEEQSLSKSFNQLESLVKGLASQDDLKKAVAEIESIKALVKEIHETPQAGGPLLNGGNPAFFMKDFNPVQVAQAEESALEKFAGEIKDPILRDKVGQELAMRKMRQALSR